MAPAIWELPDAILFHVLSFVAPATHRAKVLCHQLAPLCQDARTSLLEEERSVSLWDTILKEDYGVGDGPCTQQKRRACKRLRRSPVHRVRDAHLLIRDNTEIAYHYLSEMTNATSKKGGLSRGKLCRLLEEYGPHIRVNTTISSGGLYLVEVCRARRVHEAVILRCVQELVEERGALVDLATSEASNSSLTPLCVAAVRAMPSVVKYLLQRGASRAMKSSGRFRLYVQPKKTVRCNNATPLEFAKAMLNAEKNAGASDEDLNGLMKCIRMLE